MEGNEIGIYLKKINILLERNRNRNLKLQGLTGTQMDVLEFLYHQGGDECALARMASFFDVKHTSVLHVVKVLEKKKLIGREEKKQGGRGRRIYLTEDGRKLMEGMDQVKSAVDRCILKNMTETEIRSLQSLLEHVYDNLKENEGRRF